MKDDSVELESERGKRKLPALKRWLEVVSFSFSLLSFCGVRVALNESISSVDFSRRSSYDYGEGPRESEVVVLKERRLVPLKPVREGMHRFSFLLEVCVPGSVPDAQLIAAILDLVSMVLY